MKRIGFIGGGNMAEALISGLLRKRLFPAAEIIVSDVDPRRRRKLSRNLKVTSTADNLQVVREAGAVVLAVKPQTIDAVLAQLAAHFTLNGGRADGRAARRSRRTHHSQPHAPLVISIAAGVPLRKLEAGLGGTARVIRVMPNAPAMVGAGMAVLVRGSRATRADEAFALKIFRAVGKALTIRDESLLDVVTALSGSGPAYVYVFIKALADAGVRQGLEPQMARELTIETVRGALASATTLKTSLEDLIRQVASPGGTTQAALEVFSKRKFTTTVQAAVDAAARRSRELSRLI